MDFTLKKGVSSLCSCYTFTPCASTTGNQLIDYLTSM